METPWYRKAFGAAYPEIYAHRNGAEAIAATLAGRITLEGARVLDVACGAGRHLKTIDRLVPESERMAGDLCIREKRKYDGETKILTKEVRIIGEGGKVRESWNEQLLLFFPEDLEKILAAKGLKVRKRYGDYQGGEFRRETPRLLFFCVREER